MANFCIYRSEKLKSVMSATRRCQHNLRSHGEALGDRENPVENNRIIIIPGTPTEKFEGKSFKEFFAHQTKNLTVRKNATIAFEIILTHSPQVEMTPEMRDKWIEANVNFLCDIYGKHNLYQVCVHFSEKTVHMHAVTGCITPDGRLAASSIIKSPQHLRELQSEYAKRMESFGLSRGQDKRITRKRRTTLREWQLNQIENAEKLTAYETTFPEEKMPLNKKLEFYGNFKGECYISSEKPAPQETRETYIQ